MSDRVRVSVDVTNTGAQDGKEVVQVYVGFPGSMVERHKKLLKGFEKVWVEAGATRRVDVDVRMEELEYYSTEQECFVLEPLAYEFLVGNSAREQELVRVS